MSASVDTEDPEASPSESLLRALDARSRRSPVAIAKGAADKAMKHRVRDVLTSALWHLRPASLLPEPGTLTIVTFHRFLPVAQRRLYPWPELAVTPSALESMVGFFTGHFRVLPLSEALDALAAGRDRRPLLAITIDDGQWDGFEYAAPVFRRAGVRATFYVPTDAIDRQELLWPDRLGYALAWTTDAGIDLDPLLEVAGVRDGSAEALAEAIKRLPRPEHLRALEIIDGWLSGLSAPSWGRMMRWEEVVALATQGHEIGGHSRTHPILPALDDDALAREILGCRERLTDVLGDRSAVRSFAYPNGDHDARARELVARAGFENAVTTRPARTRAGHDPFQLGRFDLQQERNVGLLGRIDAPTLAFRLRDPDHSLASLLRTSG